MAEKIAQLDELTHDQMEDSTDENQSTHDEESNDSEESNNLEENNDSEESNNSEESNDSSTATSEEAGAGWHAEFCSFKQQAQKKFDDQTEAIHHLEQLIQDSNKNQQDQTDVFTSKTIEVLTSFQTKMSHKLGKIRTEQKRHGKILDEIPVIKSQLEKIQQGSQVSQETQVLPGIWLQLVPSQIDMLKAQLKEKQK